MSSDSHRVTEVVRMIENWVVNGESLTSLELQDLAVGLGIDEDKVQDMFRVLHRGAKEIGCAQMTVVSHALGLVYDHDQNADRQVPAQDECIPFSVILKPHDSDGRALAGRMFVCGLMIREEPARVFWLSWDDE